MSTLLLSCESSPWHGPLAPIIRPRAFSCYRNLIAVDCSRPACVALFADNRLPAAIFRIVPRSAVINIEASNPQFRDQLQRWIMKEDGHQAVSNMVKCLGFALRGEQWNNVSFSPHSVVCPLYNLTQCFPHSDLRLNEAQLVIYIVQLLKDSQRFSHWVVRSFPPYRARRYH